MSLSPQNYYNLQILLFRFGDESALDRIFQRAKPLIIRQIKQFNPNLTVESDLFKEYLGISHIAIWKSISRYNTRHSYTFLTYAMASVRHALSDYAYKERKYTENNIIDTFPTQDSEITDLDRRWYTQAETSTFWEWVNSQDAQELVEFLSESLTATSKRIFDYKLEGFTDYQIRQALGLSVDGFRQARDIFEWRSFMLVKQFEAN